VGVLALTVAFGVARHIFMIAFLSLQRGNLNRHVLRDFGAILSVGRPESGSPQR